MRSCNRGVLPGVARAPVLAALALFALVVVTVCHAAICRRRPLPLRPAPRGFEEQQRLRALEQQRQRNELAGDYYCGDGLGVNLTLHLSHAGRFRFLWHGCLGLYDSNDGPYEAESGMLMLSPQRPNHRSGLRGTPTRFRIVRWGPRQYLVPPEEWLEFCSSINGGFEPRDETHGTVYLRDGDERKRAVGWPDVPAAWRPYLLRRPVQGRVMRVRGHRATLNVGARQGLKPGLTLSTFGRRTPFGSVRLLKVDRDSSLAEPLIAGDPIRVGDEVRSRMR